MAEKPDKYLCRLKKKLILILRSQQILVSELILRLAFYINAIFHFSSACQTLQHHQYNRNS